MRFVIIAGFIITYLLASAPASAQAVSEPGGVARQTPPLNCPFVGTNRMGLYVCTPNPGIGGTVEVVNIANYGAVCNGIADDTVAINNAMEAARALYDSASGNAYRIQVSGPAGISNAPCVVSGTIDMTMFLKWSESGFPQVALVGVSLLCTGVGTICLDTSGSFNIALRDVKLVSTAAAMPAIGLQTAHPAARNYGCCIHLYENVQVEGYWSFAAWYEGAAETVTCYNCMMVNLQTTTGPVFSQTVTGGSGYTDGGYLDVAFTGGSGSGFTSHVSVQGGVAALSASGLAIENLGAIVYQGKGYQVGDILTATGLGPGTGFQVEVTGVSPYAVVYDGQNHWHMHIPARLDCNAHGDPPPWLNCPTPVDASESFTQLNYFGGSIRNYGAGVAIWSAGAQGLHVIRPYILTFGNANPPSHTNDISSANACVHLYDNAHGTNRGLYFDALCESNADNFLANYFYFYGPNGNPGADGMYVRVSPLANEHVATFGGAANITSVALSDAEIHVQQYFSQNFFESFTVTPPVLFSSTPVSWRVSGKIFVPYITNWDFTRIFFTGTLCTTVQNFNSLVRQNGVCNTGTPAPRILDTFLPPAAIALSCARQLSWFYSGPLCNYRRNSDNTTYVGYSKSDGRADIDSLSQFCSVRTVKAGVAVAGPVVLTGAKVGDVVTSVRDLTTGADVATNFETVITVDNQIQQEAVDLSASQLSFNVAAKCFVTRMWDQSGNWNAAVQDDTTLQPTAVIGDPGLSNAVTVHFGEASSAVLSTSASSITGNIFSGGSINALTGLQPYPIEANNGGWISAVVNQDDITPSVVLDRLFVTGATNLGFPTNPTTSRLGFIESATSNGTWVANGALTLGGHILDVTYNNFNLTGLSRVPTIYYDGAAQSLTSTQPTGTIAGDLSSWAIGGLPGAGRGFPGNIAEIIAWKVIPDATMYQTINRNQGAFYGVTVP